MASNFIFYSFFFCLASHVTETLAVYPPEQAPIPSFNANKIRFIELSCQSTIYPDVCLASLIRYANFVQENPARLARVAAKLAFAQIHSAALHVSSHLRGSEGLKESGETALALKDCIDSLGNAADQTKRSVSEIAKLDHEPVGPEDAWRLSNAQTWMSAALTNEETCTDGFDKTVVLNDSKVKADVFSRVGRAKEYTSNTLALVNCLANNG